MSPARRASSARVVGGPEQQDGVTDAFGALEGFGRPRQGLLEQLWQRQRERDVVEDPHDGGVVAGGSGEGDGFVGECLTTLETAAVGELGAELGEHEGSRRVVGGESIEGQLQDLDAVGVDGAGGWRTCPGCWRGRRPRGVRCHRGRRPAGGVEEGVTERGVAGLALRGAEPDGQVDAEDRIGIV